MVRRRVASGRAVGPARGPRAECLRLCGVAGMRVRRLRGRPSAARARPPRAAHWRSARARAAVATADTVSRSDEHLKWLLGGCRYRYAEPIVAAATDTTAANGGPAEPDVGEREPREPEHAERGDRRARRSRTPTGGRGHAGTAASRESGARARSSATRRRSSKRAALPVRRQLCARDSKQLARSLSASCS